MINRVPVFLSSLILACLLPGGEHGQVRAETSTEGEGGWRQVKVEGPPARWGHVAVYDSEGNRVIMFGGADKEVGPLDDLWEFSLDTETWQKIEPRGMSPSARFTAGVVEDPPRRRMILFAGYDGQSSDEVWAFSFATNRWSRLPGGPPARFDVAMTAGPNKAWAFGGFNNFDQFEAQNDLWELDLRTDTWRQLPGGPRRPAPRTNLTMGFDALSNRLYIFGGHDQTPTPLTDAWAYDLTAESWTPLSPEGMLPDAVTHQAYSFDPDCRILFMMGGDKNDAKNVSSLWALKIDPPRFIRVKSAKEPPPRQHSAMVIDAYGRLILFAGAGGSAGEDLLNDTWIFERDGSCP